MLGELGRVIRGASPRPKGDKRFYGGAIPRLMVEDVTRDGKFVIPQVDFLTEEGAKRSRPCKAGTLTIVCSGTVGVPSLLAVDACIHDGFLGLVGTKKGIDTNYLYYQIDSFRKKFDSSATHGGVFTNLTTSGVRDFAIPMPQAEAEQRAIASALSDADSLIESLEQLVAKKRQIKQGTMQALLTGKQRLPGFGGEWKEILLGNVADVLKGKALAKAHISSSGVYPCVLYGELFTKYGRVIETVDGHTNSSDGLLSICGDVLMPGSTTTTGVDLATASALLRDDVAIGGDINIIRSIGCDYDATFMANYLTHARREKVAELAQGITIHHLYGRDLRKLSLVLPPISEQIAIATILTDMDTELAELEGRLSKTRQLKQGMMQALLTGRIRLPLNAAA